MRDISKNVILHHGDCFSFMQDIPDNSVQLVVTSPPYNIGKSYEKVKTLDLYLADQEKIIEGAARITKEGGSICWQVGNYVDRGGIIPLDIALYPIFSKLGLILRNRIIWHFEHGLHSSKRLSGRYETILWFTKGKDWIFNLDSIRVPQKYPNKKYYKGPKMGQLSGNPLGKNPGDVWIIPNVKHNHIEKTIHPCQFPVELIERLVLALTNPGDIVFDPYMGVGSALVAARVHGRRAFGADIIEEYVNIASERLSKLEEGNLKTRPMQRPIFKPSSTDKTTDNFR